MRRGSPAVSLPSPRTFASLGFWPMIKLCPEGRPLMEERETSKAFSGHMVLEWQIRTQVPLKIQPVFSTWHLLSSGPESTSNKQNEIFHSPIVLKTQRLPKKKGSPQIQGQLLPHDICQIFHLRGDRTRKARLWTSEGQLWISAVFHEWRYSYLKVLNQNALGSGRGKPGIDCLTKIKIQPQPSSVLQRIEMIIPHSCLKRRKKEHFGWQITSSEVSIPPICNVCI